MDYPSNVRWLSYTSKQSRPRALWLDCWWWVAYTAGVGAVSVGAFKLAQVLF